MLNNLNLCNYPDSIRIPDNCNHTNTKQRGKKIQQESMTRAVLPFSFCYSWETKNITLSILQDTDSLYFFCIQKNGQDFPCLDNQRQRNYLYVRWRYLVVLHKTTFRNHRCKVDYTIELSFPKATWRQNTFPMDKPWWNTELDAVHKKRTGSLLPQWLDQVLTGMQTECFLLPNTSLAYYNRAHIHAGMCWQTCGPKLAGCNPGVAPELYSSSSMMRWTNVHPSIFTRQPPKVKVTFWQNTNVYIWDTSAFCI